ncbi:hypothetical protein VTK26DRAFT_7227 [Humicola hyalothermophila]
MVSPVIARAVNRHVDIGGYPGSGHVEAPEGLNFVDRLADVTDSSAISGGALLEGADFEWDQTHETRYHLPARGRAYDEVPIMKRELFSLGSAIYEITAWERPFPDLEDNEVDTRYARDEFPSLGGNVAGHIIQNCWREIYATAQEVIADLKALMADFHEELPVQTLAT